MWAKAMEVAGERTQLSWYPNSAPGIFPDVDREIEVVAALIEAGGRLLLARRPAAATRGGLWEFPGGKVEPGEEPAQALARELREELGVTVRVGEEVGAVSYEYPDLAITLRLYRCRILAGNPQPRAASKIRWVAPADLGELDLAPADRVLIRELVRSGKLAAGG